MDYLSQIPVIFEKISNVKEAVDEIKVRTEGLNGLKTDVKWLKSWHWKIVVGVIFAIIIGAIKFITK